MKYGVLFVTCLLVVSGCAGIRPAVSSENLIRVETPAPGETYVFTLHSDPPGASVYLPADEGDEPVLLGTTPLDFPIVLSRGRAPGLASRLERRPWQAHVSKDRPLIFEEVERQLVRIQFPVLELRLPGYQPETFTQAWEFPYEMRTRDARRRTEPVARSHDATAVFSTPVAPHYGVTINVRGPEHAALHAVDAEGGVGARAGDLPLTVLLGFAEVRSETGAVLDWIRWTSHETNLWSHNKQGDLFLDGFVVLEGYEPERLRDRWVTRVEPQPEQTASVLVRPTRPTQPEAEFTLEINSLPTGADLYAVRADGSWGRKVGQTPLTMTIGMAQEMTEEAPGVYVHRDWRIWAPEDTVIAHGGPDGITAFEVSVALYKEGFGIASIRQPVFTLRPGQPYPDEMVLTIPLTAADPNARSPRSDTTAEPGRTPAPPAPARVDYIWQPASPAGEAAAPGAPAGDAVDEPETRWWHRFRPRGDGN